MAMKRRRSNGFRRPSKRRRITRRRRTRRGGGRSRTWTTQSGRANLVTFKSRKVKPSAWRRIIYRDTQAKAHYRTNGAFTDVITTPMSAALMQSGARNAMQVGANAFWTILGGAQQLDEGVGVPAFQDDIIVRGGKVGISFFNESATVPIYVEVWLLMDMPNASFSGLPATPAVGFDFTMIPEFYADMARKVIHKRAFSIKPEEIGQTEVRIKPKKIDQERWFQDGEQLSWLFLITDYNNAVANTVRVTNYFNASFSADVVTPAP